MYLGVLAIVRLVNRKRPTHCRLHHSVGWDPKLNKRLKQTKPRHLSHFTDTWRAATASSGHQ